MSTAAGVVPATALSEMAPVSPEVPPSLAAFTGEVPPLLLKVVTAAVDPLEIAASLETCGLSNAVVKDRFGHQDVFGLAQELYGSARFRGAPAKDPGTKRPGGIADLGRGVVFATPTLMFAGGALALR